MENKHKIFAFIGPSGSGKSTLILKLIELFPHLKVIRSTTTRTHRTNDNDEIFYTPQLTLEEFETKRQANKFINTAVYATNFYGTQKAIADEVLANHCGTIAIVEEAVPVLRSAGYEIRLIQIKPDTEQDHSRAVERKKDDLDRASLQLEFDLTVVNSFKPGGLEESTRQLSSYISGQL